MSTPLLCVLLFAAWATVLVTAVGAVRVSRVLRGAQAANSFASGVPHGGDRYWRLNRAHLNCVENLPVFAAMVISGELAGVRSDVVSAAAVIAIGARVAQSTIHVASNHVMAVNLRFTAFLTQLGCFAAIFVEILRHAA